MKINFAENFPMSLVSEKGCLHEVFYRRTIKMLNI